MTPPLLPCRDASTVVQYDKTQEAECAVAPTMPGSALMRSLAALLILACLAAGACVPAHARDDAVLTGKERLTDKGSDEQRVDNCHVAAERRGATPRLPSGAQ